MSAASVGDQFLKQGPEQISGLLIQLCLTGSVGLGAVAFFSIMRPRYENVYQPNKVYSRSMARRGLQQFFHDAKVPEKLPEVSKGFLDWLPIVYKTTEDQLLTSLGIDATMFVKFTVTLAKASVGWLATGIVTLTLNYLSLTDGPLKAPQIPGRGEKVQDLAVSESMMYAQNFLWGHVVMAFALSAYILYLFRNLWIDFVRLRQNYFRSPEYYNSIHARTILVTNLKSSMLRDNYALADAMHEVNVMHFSTATLALKVSKLEEAVQKRERHILDLEGIMHRTFKARLDAHRPDSAANLALPNAQLPPEAQKLCDKIKALDATIYDMRRNGCEAKAIHAGFVEFEYPEDCHEVVEQLRGKALDLHIEPAPRPEDLIWRNLGDEPSVQRRKRRLGNLLVLALSVSWVFPLSAIIPLTDAATLYNVWPALGTYLWRNPKFASFIQGLVPPMLYNSFLIFLPVFFRKVSDYQGAYTKALRTKDTVRKLFLFYVVGFFVFFTAITMIINLFSGFSVDKLATSVQGPNAGAVTTAVLLKIQNFFLAVSATYVRKGGFWVNYTVNGTGFFAVELARFGPLILTFLKRKLFNLTPREALLINSPLSFNYDAVSGVLLFYFFIACVYAWVQPLILFFVPLYFASTSLIYKYELLFVFGKGSDTAGDFYPTLYKRIISSLAAAQGLFIMYLLANLVYAQAIAMAVLFIATLIAGRRIYNDHLTDSQFFNTKFGPWDPEALRQDAEARRSGRRDRYLHPSLVEHLILPLVDPRLEHLLEGYFPELSIHYQKQQQQQHRQGAGDSGSDAGSAYRDGRRDSDASLSSAFAGVTGRPLPAAVAAEGPGGGYASPGALAPAHYSSGHLPAPRPASPVSSIRKVDLAVHHMQNLSPNAPAQGHHPPPGRSPSPLSMHPPRGPNGAPHPQPLSHHQQQQYYAQYQQQQQGGGAGYLTTTTTVTTSTTGGSNGGGPISPGTPTAAQLYAQRYQHTGGGSGFQSPSPSYHEMQPTGQYRQQQYHSQVQHQHQQQMYQSPAQPAAAVTAPMMHASSPMQHQHQQHQQHAYQLPPASPAGYGGGQQQGRGQQQYYQQQQQGHGQQQGGQDGYYRR
ncbi:hypothetical protein H9P43_001273 [Blastocladiella emersonii ATCC 22665]|nr:hypothetical protein H9P43_001273 [Blastocladiella emersonii ATCC 22665]